MGWGCVRVWTGYRVPGSSAVVLGAPLPGCSSSMFTTPASTLSFFAFGLDHGHRHECRGTLRPDFECPERRHPGRRLDAERLRKSIRRSAMNLRYQVGIGQTARECKLNGTTLTMRVGVQGRVILGPAGGRADRLPLRLAVVHEGPQPKTIFTKLNRVPVTIPPGDGNVQFTTSRKI